MATTDLVEVPGGVEPPNGGFADHRGFTGVQHLASNSARIAPSGDTGKHGSAAGSERILERVIVTFSVDLSLPRPVRGPRRVERTCQRCSATYVGRANSKFCGPSCQRGGNGRGWRR